MDLILAFLYITLSLLLLGVVVAFSPTLVLTELAILTKSKTPLAHTVIYIAGIATPIVLLGLLAVVLVDPNHVVEIPKSKQVLRSIPLTDIIVGVLLLIYGIKLKNNSPAKQSKFNPDKLLSNKTLYWFGAIKIATSVSSIAAILYAARFLKTYTTESTQQLFGLIWLAIVSVTPFVLIAFSKKFSPSSFKKIQLYSDKMSDLNWRRIIALCLVFGGIFLIILGVLNLENSKVV